MALTSEIHEYSESWPARFERQKLLIEERLGDEVEEIHHVGSTSIVGLMAKPEIDLLVIVSSLAGIDLFDTGVVDLGYDVRGESGRIAGCRYFSKNVAGKRTHKAHLCVRSHRLAVEMIVFRDYLREHADHARAYERLKLGLANSNRTGMREYLDGMLTAI